MKKEDGVRPLVNKSLFGQNLLKENAMKKAMLFAITLSVMALANLGGCASKTTFSAGEPLYVDNMKLTPVKFEHTNPWGTNGLTLSIVGSEIKAVEQPQCTYVPQQPQCEEYSPPQCPPPPPQHAPRPRVQPTSGKVAPYPTKIVRLPQVQRQEPQCVMVRPPPCPPQQVFVPAPPQCCCQRCRPQQQVRLVNTRVVNSNNQGSTGWVNNAFTGSVAGLAQGGGILGAGFAIRPARVITNGAGASASASAAASSASGAP